MNRKRALSLAAFTLAAVALAASGAEIAAQEATREATLQYNAAVALQNRGVYELAADEWTKFIDTYETDPRRDKAYHYRGVCLLMADKLDAALASFETVVKTYPKFEMLESTYLYLGITQFRLGRGGKAEMYDAAAKTFETLLAKYPGSRHAAQALYYRGECFYARDRRKEAAAEYARLVEKHPESDLLDDALYALGVAQEEMGDFAAAGKTYDQFLEKFPEHPLATEVGMRKGETLFAAGQYQEAAARFAAAAAQEGFALADHATVRQAAALAELKQFAEAAALYASVPAKFPKSEYVALAQLTGGKCYYLAGEMAKARELLEKVAGGEPGAEAAHWIARSLLRESKPAEALAVVEKALPAASGAVVVQLLMDQADAVYEIAERRGESVALYAAVAEKHPEDPAAPQARYMAAFAALGEGEHATAIQQADAFLAAHADKPLALDVTYVAAEANLQLGKPAEAEKLYAELLEKDPNHADAEAWKVRRALCLHIEKKFQEVIDVLAPEAAKLGAAEAKAEAHYLVGSSQAELKQFDAALKSLEASRAASTAWRQADDTLLVLAHVQEQFGQRDKAAETLRTLVAEHPNSRVLDRAHYRLGELALARGAPAEAATEYQRVIDQFPQSPLVPHALFGLGWVKLNQNEFAEAEKTFDALVTKHAEHALVPRARYARGMARQQLGRFDAAAADVEALLAADPTPAERSDARYVLGLCQVGQKKYAEAAATFQALIDDDPNYASMDKVLYELGWALKSQEKEKEAVEVFARLAEKHGDSPLAVESHYHVGEAAYAAGDFKAAAVAYHAAMQKAARTELGEKAVHKLAWTYFRQDRIEDAQKTFAYQRKTWPDGPLSSDAAFMDGQCLFKQGEYAAAIQALEAVKAPSGRDFDVLSQLLKGQAAGQLDQWQQSLDVLSKAAAAFPDSAWLPDILFEQGMAQMKLGKPDEATALFEQVIAKTNREIAARAQFMIGEIEFEQKKHADAVRSFFKVIYGYSAPEWQANAAYEAARCFEVLKRIDQAIKQYEELIEKFPESDKVPLAKERLAALKG
jgi:cellulose synthase operon protein C